MGLLNITPSALECLAGSCEMWAGDVAVASTALASLEAWQPSAAAAAAIGARLGLSGEELSARMAATAGKLTTAAGTFTTQDEQSAAAVTSVLPDF